MFLFLSAKAYARFEVQQYCLTFVATILSTLSTTGYLVGFILVFGYVILRCGNGILRDPGRLPLFVLVLVVNVVGDAIRDVLDPRVSSE